MLIRKILIFRAIFFVSTFIGIPSASYGHENVDELIQKLKKITAEQAAKEKERDLASRTFIDSRVSPNNERSGTEIALALETYEFSGALIRPFYLHPNVRSNVKFAVLIMSDGEVGRCTLARGEDPVPESFFNRICGSIKKMYFGKKNSQIGDNLLPLNIQRPMEDATSAK
jgi:hypothetical protein